MNRSDRQIAEAWGRSAERLAIFALACKGYRIVARRWRAPSGEIDLVARKGRLLVAVEVKARRGGDEHPVTLRQWLRIAKALEAYIAHNPALSQLDRRYDLVVVAPWRWPRHTPDAWRP
ncbi:MAG: YraN family protein [Rhodospirillales bacterium]|nr:YraN family protein [Rhodospirillales bacterium]